MNWNQALFPSLHDRKETSALLSQGHFFGWDIVSQRGTAQPEALTVEGLVIGRSGFPATKHNAYPFVSQRAQGGMMRFTARSLLVVMGPSPIRLRNGFSSKLMEGLPQECGTGQAPVNPNAFSAFLGDGRDSGELLHFSSELESVAIGAECRQQTWSQYWPSSRKATKQGRVVMLIKQRCDLLILAVNGFCQRGNLRGQSLHHHFRSQQDSPIFGQRLSLLDVPHQLLQVVLAAITLVLIKLADRRSRRSFQILQRWPAQKKSTSSSRVQLTEPVQRLRKVGLQGRRQLIRQSGPFINEASPAFGQQLNTAGQYVVGNPNSQMPAMRYQDVQQQIGIRGIVLGTTGIERLTHFRHRNGVDRIEVQKLDMHQRVDQCPALLLDGNRNGSATKLIPQLLNP